MGRKCYYWFVCIFVNGGWYELVSRDCVRVEIIFCCFYFGLIGDLLNGFFFFWSGGNSIFDLLE